MTLLEDIRKKAGLNENHLNENYNSYVGIARKDIAFKIKKFLKDQSTGSINQFFEGVKVLPKKDYDEFAKKNNIKSLSVFNSSFFYAVEEEFSLLMDDWNNIKEVKFLDDFKNLK